ncbi:Acyl-CoA dehydrogenase family member 10 isoform X2 [Aphelenchoides bicaudatus]|nr:Acyl-CoA dehydrogenase family member 10 isoform X2 [Aphelenchoides bicaudatus]
MLACNSGKSRIVRSRLLDERLSMAKRGLRGLYKTIIFDVAGTLVNISNHLEYERLNKIVKELTTSQTILPEQDSTEVDLMRAGQSTVHKLNMEEFEKQLLAESLVKNSEICTAIKLLKKNGYRVALLINNDMWAKSRSSILEESQNLIDAEPATPNNQKKSHSEVYEMILSKFQTPPASCILVDKLLANLRSAERLGITAIHIEDHESAVCQLESLLNISLLLNADLH